MKSALEPEARALRLRILEGRAAGTLVVHEVYRSLQGEGTRAGLPCVFVRLAGCQMRCVYCDTPHAFHQGESRTVAALAEQVLGFGDALVQVTGGEPLLQDDVHDLMERLADAGRTVLLETGGGIDTSNVDPRVCVILDVKTPGSGECAGNVWTNLDRLRPHDEVKFVICDEADFAWSLDVIRRHRLAERVPVLVSPAFGRVGLDDLARWVLECGLPLRLQVQLHKLVWGANRRGV
jgi:7-carboxy-7-deazaguanine synthase